MSSPHTDEKVVWQSTKYFWSFTAEQCSSIVLMGRRCKKKPQKKPNKRKKDTVSPYSSSRINNVSGRSQIDMKRHYLHLFSDEILTVVSDGLHNMAKSHFWVLNLLLIFNGTTCQDLHTSSVTLPIIFNMASFPLVISVMLLWQSW